jgi:hypothetical protein
MINLRFNPSIHFRFTKDIEKTAIVDAWPQALLLQSFGLHL